MEKADSVRNMEHPSPPCSGETPLSTINDGTSNDATQEITPTTPNHIQIPISTNPVDEDHTPTSSPTAVSDDNRNSNGPHVTPNTFKTQKLDIEHAFVANDPRQWKAWRKNLNLLIISVAAVAPTLGANIYNPAFNQIKSQLRATDHEIAMSLSLFILVQGVAPLVWSSTSEIVGRKFVYIVALSMFSVGCAAAGAAKNMAVLIGMRILQAAGAAAALTLGSGTIADMYEPHERGFRVGIYYAMPLLGPSIGPLIGGILVQAWTWRATFWFMVIFGGISLLTFIFFEESFRKERSLAYLSAKKRAIARQQGASGSWFGSKSASRALSRVPSRTGVKSPTTEHMDIEAGRVAHGVGDPTPIENDNTDVKLTIADVNPLGPAWQVLQQKSNITILFASAVCFGFNYGICYTAAITFAEAPYSYNALEIGCILLALGMGSVGGSVLGGRWSDIILSRLKAKNGGVSQPEMRLKSTIIALAILPFSVIGYAWMCHAHIHVAGPIVMLVISGFALMWGYSSMLAYIVDSNPGRASSAIAMNSAFRGVSGLVAAEASQPIQNAIGDGGLYSIWAGLLFGVVALVIVTAKYGETWRAAEEKAHFEKRMKEAESGAIEKC